MMENRRLGIVLIVAQGAMFTAETAIVHRMGPSVSAMQLALLRGIGGLLVVVVLLRGKVLPAFKTCQLRLQLLRAFVAVPVMFAMLYSFSKLPFADATAIGYTQVIFITIFSYLLDGSRISSQRWLAALIGFSGAILVVNPAFSGWNAAYLAALYAAALNGVSFVFNRHLQRPGGDSNITTMLYVNLVSVACYAPFGLNEDIPRSDEWWWITTAVLISGPIGTYLGITAVRFADTSILGPFTLFRLVFAMILGVAIFEEIPSFQSLLGVSLILGACALSIAGSRMTSTVAKQPRVLPIVR